MANANDVRIKPIPITLDKPRTLLYDFNAFMELEDLYGDINKAFKGLEQLKMRPIRDMIWAGLIHEDESLTPKQVGKMLHVLNLEEIATKITEALGISLPEPEAAPGKLGE
jgi:hypothetical protein